MNALTNYEIKALNNLNTETIKMEFGNKVQEIISNLDVYIAGSPVNAVNATIVLTLSGIVKHGETVSINNPAITGTPIDIYEFLSDEAQSKTIATNKAVNIKAYTNKASGTLTIDTRPTSGDTMTIGGKVYTFVPVGTDTADGEISIGTDLASAQANIIAAINGTDDINTPNSLVSVTDFVTDVCTITAYIGGTSGNAIDTTETFTAETNIFTKGTLESGTDCSAANAITALVAAITALDSQWISASDGEGDTVVLTAKIAGAYGNSIEVEKTLANGAFTDNAAKLSGGIDGTVGFKGKPAIDSSYLYFCIEDNTVSGKNWRRISLGDAY